MTLLRLSLLPPRFSVFPGVWPSVPSSPSTPRYDFRFVASGEDGRLLNRLFEGGFGNADIETARLGRDFAAPLNESRLEPGVGSRLPFRFSVGVEGVPCSWRIRGRAVEAILPMGCKGDEG